MSNPCFPRNKTSVEVQQSRRRRRGEVKEEVSGERPLKHMKENTETKELEAGKRRDGMGLQEIITLIVILCGGCCSPEYMG